MMQIKYGKNYANGVDEELSLSLSLSLWRRGRLEDKVSRLSGRGQSLKSVIIQTPSGSANQWDTWTHFSWAESMVWSSSHPLDNEKTILLQPKWSNESSTHGQLIPATSCPRSLSKGLIFLLMTFAFSFYPKKLFMELLAGVSCISNTKKWGFFFKLVNHSWAALLDQNNLKQSPWRAKDPRVISLLS
jgi:hypothetical protein